MLRNACFQRIKDHVVMLCNEKGPGVPGPLFTDVVRFS
jgi:hypothetical protein